MPLADAADKLADIPRPFQCQARAAQVLPVTVERLFSNSVHKKKRHRGWDLRICCCISEVFIGWCFNLARFPFAGPFARSGQLETPTASPRLRPHHAHLQKSSAAQCVEVNEHLLRLQDKAHEGEDPGRTKQDPHRWPVACSCAMAFSWNLTCASFFAKKHSGRARPAPLT